MLDLSSSVIVVEGKSDVALLSSIIKSNFVTTNGSEVSRETINYLKILAKTYPIIILTDPDGPGRIIRSRLEQELNDVQHIFLNKKDCIKKNKVGVAEADISTIRLAFEHIIPGPSVDVGNLNTTHLLNLLLVGNEEAGARRKFIGEYYHFGQSNAKTLLKRLNQINISFNEIKEVLINAGYKC